MTASERKANGIENLPATLAEAMGYLRNDAVIMDTLGDHIATQYLAGKEAECIEYGTRVSGWELDKYLIAY